MAIHEWPHRVSRRRVVALAVLITLTVPFVCVALRLQVLTVRSALATSTATAVLHSDGLGPSFRGASKRDVFIVEGYLTKYSNVVLRMYVIEPRTPPLCVAKYIATRSRHQNGSPIVKKVAFPVAMCGLALPCGQTQRRLIVSFSGEGRSRDVTCFVPNEVTKRRCYDFSGMLRGERIVYIEGMSTWIDPSEATVETFSRVNPDANVIVITVGKE